MIKAFLSILVILVSLAICHDFNFSDTALVEIWSKHDLGFVADTVHAVVWWPSGERYYLRTVGGGERWSDREPIIIKGE